MTPGYSIRNYQSEDEEHVLDILSQELQGWAASSDRRDLWNWKHFANPFGPSHVMVACNDREEIIGVLAYMRWQIRLGNQLIQSVRVTDSATHPTCRRLGISLALRQRLVEVAQREGAILMFGTPNQYALGVSRKSGGRLAGKIRLFIRVLRHRHFVTELVRSRLKKQFLSQYQPQDFFRYEPQPLGRLLEYREGLNRLLEQDQQLQNKSYRTHRSWEYLRWRYADHPLIPYYTVYREHCGELLGCAIFRTDTYHSLKGIVLNELLLSRAEEQLALTLLDQLLNILNTDYVVAYFPKSSLHRRILGKRGFQRIPFRDYYLTVGVWDSTLGDEPLLSDNWGLTPGELEEAWAWR